MAFYQPRFTSGYQGDLYGKLIQHIWLFIVMFQLLIRVSTAATDKNVQYLSVITGQSVRLHCSVNFPDPVNWRHELVGTGSPNTVYYDGFGLTGFYRSGGRHSIEDGTNNLMIINVTDSDAGKYACEDKLLEMNVDVYDIVILKSRPTCRSNIILADVIGENNCGINPDEIRLRCSVTYHGNFVPLLRWRHPEERNITITSDALNPIGDETISIASTLTVIATLKLNNTHFTCQVADSSSTGIATECRTETLLVKYFHNSFPELRKPIDGELVSCEDYNTNRKFCVYSWIGETKEIEGSVLTTGEEGTFICLARCEIRNRTCYSTPVRIHISGWSKTTLAIYRFINILLVILIVIAAVKMNTEKFESFLRFLRKKIVAKVYYATYSPVETADIDTETAHLLKEHNDPVCAKYYNIGETHSFEKNSSVPFTITRVLGMGCFGTAFLVNHNDHGQVVLKILKPFGRSRSKLEIEQALPTYKLNHPNIVGILEVYLVSTIGGLFLEYMKHGAIDEFIEEFNVTWQWKLQIINDVAQAMLFLHKRQPIIIHGNLKPQNILIDEGYRAKISDARLTFTWNMKQSSQDSHLYATLPYVAPEYLVNPNEEKNVKFDVYSFAISVWEIFSEKQHSADFKVRNLTKKFVIEGTRPFVDDIIHAVPESQLELMKKCWDKQVQIRPDFDEIVNILERELQQLKENPQSPTKKWKDNRSFCSNGRKLDTKGIV